MRRRRLFAGTGSLLVATTAGCLTTDLEPRAAVDPAERYESAVETLVDGADEFRATVASIDDPRAGPDSVDVSTIEARLEDAAGDLPDGGDLADDAADTPTETELEAAADAIAFLEDGVDALEATDEALESFYVGRQVLVDDHPDDAIGVFESAADAARTVSDESASAEASLDAVDFTAVDDGFDRDSLASSLADLERIGDLLESLAIGYAEYAEGVRPLQGGWDAFSREVFDVAVSQFEEARDAYAVAADTFEEIDDDGPEEFRSERDLMACLAASRRDAAELFADGSATYDDGEDGSDAMAAGEDELERCEEEAERS